MDKGSVRKSVVLIIVILGLGLMLIYSLLLLKKCQNRIDAKGMRLDTNATEETYETYEEDELAQRNIFFSGIEDAKVSRGEVIALENLKENEDFLMKYIILDAKTNNLLFETDLIPSGNRVYWDPFKNLKTGVHEIAFVEEPYYEKDGEYMPLTSGKNIVTIEIID